MARSWYSEVASVCGDAARAIANADGRMSVLYALSVQCDGRGWNCVSMLSAYNWAWPWISDPVDGEGVSADLKVLQLLFAKAEAEAEG